MAAIDPFAGLVPGSADRLLEALDPEQRCAWVITSRSSAKVRHVADDGRVAASQVDGRHWSTLEGVAEVRTDEESVCRAVERYAARRTALKEAVRTAATPEERDAAVRALSRLPRDASPVRVRNRDQVDGRPRGYLRKAGLSRISFRTRS